MLLEIHIAAGGTAIVLGAIALSVKKGGDVHRRVGLLFVAAMLVMAVTASILEYILEPAATNLTAALMTIYFVGTALTTVRPPSRWTRAINIAALVLAIGVVAAMLMSGIQAVNTPGLSSGGVPFRTIGVMSFILAAVVLLCVAGDVKVLISGLPCGGPRLARHLWRMCFALFIAAASFFSIQERVARLLPEALTSAPIRALPIALIFAVMFYWLWRVRRRKGLGVIVRNQTLRSERM